MSKVLKNVHASVKDLHGIGLVSDSTMREFDEICSAPLQDAEVASTRKRKGSRADTKPHS